MIHFRIQRIYEHLSRSARRIAKVLKFAAPRVVLPLHTLGGPTISYSGWPYHFILWVVLPFHTLGGPTISYSGWSYHFIYLRLSNGKTFALWGAGSSPKRHSWSRGSISVSKLTCAIIPDLRAVNIGRTYTEHKCDKWGMQMVGDCRLEFCIEQNFQWRHLTLLHEDAVSWT